YPHWVRPARFAPAWGRVGVPLGEGEIRMKTWMSRRRLGIGALVGALAVAGVLGWRAHEGHSADVKRPDPQALERARLQVKMLDDLNKSAVVHITNIYVGARERTP